MQLDSTRMFFDPADAAAFARSEDLPATMDAVRTFLFDHGLLGVGAPSPDVVGIAYPGGAVQGDEGNVAFRFVTDYMDSAANGDL
jgi:NitT/TauT family transport system substrate-binding protein